MAKILGCFGAGKGGGTSGQQNHEAQQQNYEAQPYRVKDELGFAFSKPGFTLSGLGSAVLKPGFDEALRIIKTRLRRNALCSTLSGLGSDTFETRLHVIWARLRNIKTRLLFRAFCTFEGDRLGFTLLKLGSTLSRLGTALLKPGFEEPLKQTGHGFIMFLEFQKYKYRAFDLFVTKSCPSE